MGKSMEEINDALIALIILKVFAQSAFKDSLWKKKKKQKPIKNLPQNKPQIKVLLKKLLSCLFIVYLYRHSPAPYLPSSKIVSNLEKAI